MKKIITSFLLLTIGFFYVSGQDFIEEEVEIGKIKGTLSIPSKKTKTAILLISGSGPTDRDGNSALGLNNNSLKMVAEELTIAGLAVLRYDKRGVAASETAIPSYSELRFQDLVKDANNWLDFLSKEGYKKIIVIGHSQGSLVGMMAAKSNARVHAFISLAGLSTDAGSALIRQLTVQSKELGDHAREKIDSLRSGHMVKRYSPLLLSLFGPETQPYLKSYIPYTPTEEIKRLSIPILIINGTTDIQVGVNEAKELKEAYPEAELLIIDGMNHLLKDAPEDRTKNMATYNEPDLPLSRGLVTGILDFIQKL